MKPSSLLSLPPILCVAAAAQSPADRFGDDPAQDVRRYAIELRVDVAAQRLIGDVHYTVDAVEPLATIRLDALHSDSWNVTFRGENGDELPANWTDRDVTLTLPTTVAKGASVRFAAHLEGTPVDGFYFRPNRYGEPMAFTDHYAIRARGWLPCEDNPADRAHFSLRLDYPDGDEAIGFGVATAAPQDATPAPTGFRTLWLDGSAEIPPYMFAIVVGPLARVHEGGDVRLVDHLVYRRDVDAARQLLVHDAEWIARMEVQFGPYAFGSYTTVQCPTRWGGFEAPGTVQLAENLFDSPGGGTGTLAHELVHMWFGDAVGYAEWRDVWLSEGFASYFGPWLYAASGGPSLTDSMASMRESWRRSRVGLTKSIRDDRFDDPDQALNANTYPKGAWVLHMLRAELGDGEFFAALKAYYGRHRGTSVRTADFVAAIEQSAGVQLGWFFDQWLDRVGCPELRAIAEDDGVSVEQTQRGEPYTFWLCVEVGPAGDRHQHRLRVTERSQHFRFDGPSSDPTLDPKVELLFRDAR